MALALDGSLLLCTLQAFKEESQNAPLEPKKEDSVETLQNLPLKAVSIPAFIDHVRHPPPRSSPLLVTSIEWRTSSRKDMYHEYVVLYVSTCAQNAPGVAVRIDGCGNLGVKTRWWNLWPCYLSAKTTRRSTTVLAGTVGDPTADPTTGTLAMKYTHWTHKLQSPALIPDLKRAMERARKDACTTLNHAVRPYVLDSLHMSDRQVLQGRRWSGARGLEHVHTDIGSTLADAMNTSIVRCTFQMFLAKVLPSRALWRTARRNIRVREEYSRAVHNYRQELRRITHLLPDIDSETRSRILSSWGIEETENATPLLMQLLTKFLSRHTFISPYAPVATLADVASHLDSLVPLLPTSGPTLDFCDLYVRTLLFRSPDKLWHSYATSTPPMLAGYMRATWYRARNSQKFWLCFDIFMQWLIALLVIPADHGSGLWSAVLPILMHAMIVVPWILKERKTWRSIWKMYEGDMIQEQGEVWSDDSSTYSSRSTTFLLKTGWGRA